MQEHDQPDKCQSELHRLQLFTEIKLSVKYLLRDFDLKLEGMNFTSTVAGFRTNSTDVLHLFKGFCFGASATTLTKLKINM